MEKKILARITELKSLYPERYKAIKEDLNVTVDLPVKCVKTKYPAEDVDQVKDNQEQATR